MIADDLVSDRVFLISSGESIEFAVTSGSAWILQEFLQEHVLKRTNRETDAAVLLRLLYMRVGCYFNASVLRQRYRINSESGENLDEPIGVVLDPSLPSFGEALTQSREILWCERDETLRLLIGNRGSLELWLRLFRVYVDLEEWPMALWMILLLRRNFNLSKLRAEGISEYLEFFEIAARAGCFWGSFIGAESMNELTNGLKEVACEGASYASLVISIGNWLRIGLETSDNESYVYLPSNLTAC